MDFGPPVASKTLLQWLQFLKIICQDALFNLKVQIVEVSQEEVSQDDGPILIDYMISTVLIY